MATRRSMEGSPTFLGIGAQKSGTTSIHQYLLSHPRIFVPTRKELRFFAYEENPPDYRGPGDEVIPSRIIASWTEYLAAFRGSESHAARGEISPEYLMLAERAAPQILRRLPDIRLFAVLRHPAERAYSNYLHAVRLGREPLSDFREALEREEERIGRRWSPLFWYRKNSCYGRQLSEFYDRFPRNRIRIYLYEDLVQDPAGLMEDVYRFLGVDPGHRPDVTMRYNPSAIPKFRTFYRLLQNVRNRTRFLDGVVPAEWRNPIHAAVRNRVSRPAPPLPDAVRAELTAYYREDILRLQDLIRRDLRMWMKGA
jgi:hypothetical protein